MKYYSAIKAGFFDTSIHQKFFVLNQEEKLIPDPGGPIADAVALEDQAYEELLIGQSAGKLIIGNQHGQPVLTDPEPLSSEQLKAIAKDQLDSVAGTARSRFITTVPGQEGTYQLKVDEALDYIAAGSPADTSPYVMLTAEAEGRNILVSDLANEVLLVRDQWVLIAAQIEKLRMSGKIAVDAAADDSDFDAIAQPYIDQLKLIQPE